MKNLKLKLSTIRHRIRWCLSDVKLCLWFIVRAWDAIRGKIIIIDSRFVESKGGFKYFQINISKRPLDKKADYSKW